MEKPPADRVAAINLARRIRALLPQSMLRDQAVVGRQLQFLIKSGHEPAPRLFAKLTLLEKRMVESIREKENRLFRKPSVSYPGELPITSRRQEIVRAIRHHPVVIISGETGCGKSTQIPKMCLEAGRGSAGKIGCTQPRRIAAITIAHRIAEEMGEKIGHSVGYKIRFQDRTNRDAYIKVMTDGMLLAETQGDRRLYEYDTLIIDEAHERSLNIDFLLGITRTLLPARPELKLIITSATLDTEKFAEAFGNAPVIKVGGRMYPVEVEYASAESLPGDLDDSDYIEKAVTAVQLLKSKKRPGDILIFMPTEQDILETCERLEGKHYPGVTILPLYARLPAAQQGRVYSVQGPKIVVATNVAETSLTIPGIRYVIDTGLARISQYQPGTRINSLPISPISRSSAEQRKGRCGRVEAGVCIRLYSEKDYESRPQFTPPEVLRSNLAEVILRMIDLDLGDPSDFPFVDRPHQKNIKDGYETLLELGAIDSDGSAYELTPLGRQMAQMPLDPRISRMLLEAQKESCLPEVAVIASVLSIRDPRERPPEKTVQADEIHASFRHPDSDFLSLLAIWNRYRSPSENLTSKAKQRRFCNEHFLSYARMREWGFVHDQVVSILEEQKLSAGQKNKTEPSASPYSGIHRSILSGYLSNIATLKEKNIYEAAKGREVMVFPGSTLFNKSRPWIVAAEMVKTSRLFARTAAKVDPAWLEDLGGELCRSSYSEPHWDREGGEVRALERITLFGLAIVSGRETSYGPVHPEEAHKIFVRSALVGGQVQAPPGFLKHNLDLLQRLSRMEEKLRRREILVKEDAMADFYSRRLSGVYDLRGLERRIRSAGGDDFLKMSEKDLLLFFPDEKELSRFPEEISLGGRPFKTIYKFAPGEETDGITLRIPSVLIKSIPFESLEWGVAGQFKEKIAAMIRGLPKPYRKQLMPVAEKVDIIVREMVPTDPSLFKTLARFAKERFQADIPASAWESAEIPHHLKIRIAVTDHADREVTWGRDYESLRKSVKPSGVPDDLPAWTSARQNWEKSGVEAWDFGPLPESVVVGSFMTGFPGLESAAHSVNIRLFKTHQEALDSHKKGVEVLLLARFMKDLEFVKRYLVLPEDAGPSTLYFGGKSQLEKSIIDRLRREVFQKNLRTKEEFDSYSGTVVKALFEKGHELRQTTLRVLDAYQKTSHALQSIEQAHQANRTVTAICAAIRKELERLAPKDFLESFDLEHLAHLPRYLGALELRAERAKNDPEKDRNKASQVEVFRRTLDRLQKTITAQTPPEKKNAVEEFRWMTEEFQVSLFAPEFKTAFPISAKRLAVKLKEIEALS